MTRFRLRIILFVSLMALGMLGSREASAQLGESLGGMIESLAAKVVPVRGDDVSASMTLEVKAGGLPTQNKEIGELSTPKALLTSSPALRRLLGEDPMYIYDPKNRPDPMLVPWTRSRVMCTELDEIAKAAIEQKNWQMAEMAYQQMSQLDVEEYRLKAEEGMVGLNALVAKEAEAQALAVGKPLEAKLPPWIMTNTNGVIVDKREPMCIVGTFILKKGDLVPRQPMDVLVSNIEPGAVHYQVLDKTFVVPIREGE